MRWPLVFSVFAALLLSGCQGQGVGIDPFGRTTIPPPPTGAARPLTVDPYYGGQGSAPPPLVPLPTQGSSNLAPAPRTSDSWSAAGSQNVEVTSSPGRLRPVPSFIENMSGGNGVTLTAGNPDAWSENPASTAEYQAPTDRRAPTLSPPTLSPAPQGLPFRTPPSIPAERQDLSRLPPATSRTSGGITTTRLRPPEIDAAGPYGQASDYTWLKGRLEYVAGKRQWKLRYIPKDEPIDNYGGIVVLPATTELENFRTGDFVVVHGRLAEARTYVPSFPASYVVAQAQRQD